MTTICIEASYIACTSAQVKLPEGKTWEDVAQWYVKWDTLNLRFKGCDDWEAIDLDSNAGEVIDWKRPADVTIYPVSEEGEDDGEVDYGNELASS